MVSDENRDIQDKEKLLPVAPVLDVSPDVLVRIASFAADTPEPNERLKAAAAHYPR